MDSRTGGNWGDTPPQRAAPAVRAEPGSRACLYPWGQWQTWGAIPGGERGWGGRGGEVENSAGSGEDEESDPSRRGETWQGGRGDAEGRTRG